MFEKLVIQRMLKASGGNDVLSMWDGMWAVPRSVCVTVTHNFIILKGSDKSYN